MREESPLESAMNAKLVMAMESSPECNNYIGGHDLYSRELKRYNVMGVRFDVDVRYNVLDVVGQGAYGVVCAAHDEDKDESVAIKKIFNPFEYVTCAKRTLREIRLLRLLRHDNVIRLRTLLPPVRADGFKDLYIVLDLMETDLASVIKSPQPLSDDHVQFFLYQVLRGLKFLHTSTPAVTHRDLKPRNLLVNSNCDLKICDFGLARVDFDLAYHQQCGAKVMTDYVATRWYRAPEIIAGYVEYTKAVDMWAVGCILAELLGRKPLWPGSDSKQQLGLICQCIGKPAKTTIDRIQQPEIRSFVSALPDESSKFDDSAPPHVQQSTSYKQREQFLRGGLQHGNIGVRFVELYPEANPLACDLLSKLLVFDPEVRFDVEAALDHEYLDQLHYPDDEPRGPEIPLEAFDFESLDLGVDELQNEILREISYYHQENNIAGFSDSDEANDDNDKLGPLRSSMPQGLVSPAETSHQPSFRPHTYTTDSGR